jgi:hypothetical protein
LPQDATGLHQVGRGVLLREALSPAALAYKEDGAEIVRKLARQVAEAAQLKWEEANALVLRRGPYLVAAGLDESVPNAPPLVLRGRFIDLFDAELPVRTSMALEPGKRALLYDLDAVKTSSPRVVAAACKLSQERFAGNILSFSAQGIANTEAVIRILAAGLPSRVLVGGKALPRDSSVASSGTLQLRFQNSVNETPVEVHFGQSGQLEER